MADQLQALTEARDKLAEARELAAVRRELETLELLEAMVEPDPWILAQEEWGQRIDRNEMLADIGWGAACYLADDFNTRKDGDDRPILETEIQLAQHRARARLIALEVPPAIGALRSLVNYVIGTKWAFKSAPRVAEDSAAGTISAALQGVVDLILEANKWIGRRDRETFSRTIRDGESFLRIKLGPGGIPRITFAEPCWVTEPRNKQELNYWLGCDQRHESSWKWGIHTAVNDPATPLGYHVVYDGAGEVWDYLTPDEFHHIKVGTDEGVKRGLSELYPVRNDLPRAHKVFQMVADGAAAQAAIAGVKQFGDKAKASDIEAINAGSRTHSRTQATQWGGREIDVMNFDRPKIISAKGYDWKDGPMGSSRNPNLILAGQAVLRLVGARWSMPEWMVSGDASNNNLASSLVAESPFVKAAEAEQSFYGQEFVELIWKAVGAYLRGGRSIGGLNNLAELRATVKITPTAPPVASRDSLKEVQTAKEKQAMGIASRQTLATELGLDYDVERPLIEAEPPLPNASTPAAPALAGAIQGAIESAETAADVKTILREIRDEMGGLNV